MNDWFILMGAAFVLLWLIFNIKKSRRFNLVDHWLHHKLSRNRSGFYWQVIAFLNDPKLMVVWAVLLASYLLNENKDVTAFWVLGTLGFTDLIGIGLKKLIKRQRPRMHSDLDDSFSFPSGHVLGATTMALIILQLFSPKMGAGLAVVLLILWLMVVVSRLRLRAHYPSDILGATSLAVLCFAVAQQILLAL